METRSYNVYKFDELPKEAQQEAIERWREDDDLPFLSEYLEEIAGDLLVKNGIVVDDLKVYYSLSYCQGDGAMIEMKNATWNKAKKYSIDVKQSGHYYHYNSKEITIQDENGNDAPEKLQDSFNELYVKICQELAKSGYKYIEDTQSDEGIMDTLRVNDYDFTLDGKID